MKCNNPLQNPGSNTETADQLSKPQLQKQTRTHTHNKTPSPVHLKSKSTSSVVLITGCSSGFGKQISVALAEAGYQVIATMRDITKKEPLLQEASARNIGDRLHILPLDVTNQDSITQAIDDTLRLFGKIDVLINNAGYATGGFTEEIPLEEWRRQFETNFFGAVATTQAVLKHMRERRSGLIINMSSISGQFGFPMLGPYTASKHALEGFSESLRLEMLPFGVQVVLIEPGSYRTDIWQKSVDAAALSPESPYHTLLVYLQQQAKHNATHSGDPEEVVQTVLRIVKTPEPSFRYPVGKSVKNLLFSKKMLPWKFIELIVKKQLHKILKK
ncbi:SDR family oxidoreductase [Brevibacillus laterosporus]|uniref:SDR family oxidoreductase n=1 Tax=Brevibacillus laterosporus TaxID=1465 RepID=UPI000E6D4E47|nr:SDR family oxidoreductase [Brevibacillus laterosporus]AYB39316.1 SDR family oxidoreductase [Brevibacillus laterosporus]MBM7108624.1 Cyclopentanol dehydrogenase [Brevibacillus laterosporus]